MMTRMIIRRAWRRLPSPHVFSKLNFTGTLDWPGNRRRRRRRRRHSWCPFRGRWRLELRRPIPSFFSKGPRRLHCRAHSPRGSKGSPSQRRGDTAMVVRYLSGADFAELVSNRRTHTWATHVYLRPTYRISKLGIRAPLRHPRIPLNGVAWPKRTQPL